MAVDPVCKMEISEDDAAAKFEYEGQTYIFCSTACKEEFEKEPGKYAASEG